MADIFTAGPLLANGDASAKSANGRSITASGVLPGETFTGMVEDGHMDIAHIETASPQRVEPPCPDFDQCGGCVAQHMNDTLYDTWKTTMVREALAGYGIEAPISPVIHTPPATRRRAAFSVRHEGNGLLFGFTRRKSHEIIEFQDCKVILPILNQARGALKAVARAALPLMKTGSRPATMAVTVTRTGVDVALTHAPKLNDERREAAIAVALKAKLARLSFNGELLVEERKPMVQFDGLPVEFPANGFLQAVVSAEEAMRALVHDHLRGASRVLDLFCGSGTFALPLSRMSSVHAVEMEGPALNALDAAWRRLNGPEKLKSLTTERRNLFDRALPVSEMEGYDGLVFDPPKAGAEMQSQEIAKSDIAKVAAVSCNPVTLARDLRILLDGGYTISSITPVDQFKWAAHVEVVALLEKQVKRKARPLLG